MALLRGDKSCRWQLLNATGCKSVAKKEIMKAVEIAVC